MRRTLLATFLFLMTIPLVLGQSFPQPRGMVNDYARLLTQSETTRLEALAGEIRQKAGIEIAFVTLDAIPDGQDISIYTVELGHAWGVGQKGTDRGAVLLYKTGKTDGSGRQVYLATGYGLEGEIPDGVAGRILDSVTIPYLREGKILDGFAATAFEIVRLVEPDLQLTGAVPRQLQRSRQNQEVSPFGLILMLVVVAILMSSRMGRAILFGMLLSSMFGRRGGWGGGGGGFGGGFGGFGGGGFGGGGAGRSF